MTSKEGQIDGCVGLHSNNPLFCEGYKNGPPRSDKCTAFRMGRLRVMFEDDREGY